MQNACKYCLLSRESFTDALYMALIESIVQLHNIQIIRGCSAKTQIFLFPVAMPLGGTG